MAKFAFTPDQIKDELTDCIEHGLTNDQIVSRYDDVGPHLRRWLTNRRRALKKFWDSF